jgi:NAD-dependent deacetylase
MATLPESASHPGTAVTLAGHRNIVVLTGAGISQSAGLPTYRGPGGLWSDPELARLSDIEALRSRRSEACTMFWRFHQSIKRVEPTAAHRALAAFEARLPAHASFLLITQNVDGLHQRAGSQRVCEYHGTLLRWRCETCEAETEPPEGDPPACCGLLMRPAAVLFGELIPPNADHAATRALRDCDLFVAIGTSGTVFPASGFVRWAAYNGARRILVNLEIDDEARDAYSECHTGTADELVPRLFG